jgi:hypothetical protein
MANVETDIALLAPVPYEHLDSARSMTRVAFGSRSDEIWRLNQLRKGKDVDVYIYASHSGIPDPSVTWKAQFVSMVEAMGGVYPDPARAKAVRPPTTVTDTPDALLFWEVEGLVELKTLQPPEAPIPLYRFRTWVDPSKYGANNRGKVIKGAPEGPIVIWADLEPIKP